MGKTKNDADAFEAKVVALLEGFRDRLPATEEKVLLRGEKMTLRGVHDRLTAILRAREAVRRARKVLDEALRNLRATEEEDQRFHEAVVHHLRVRYGREAVRLKPFGLDVV
jgi:hypothetical protein